MLASGTQAPIFILGNHRSGTTWLHQLLADTGLFEYLTAYDVIVNRSGADIPTATAPPSDAFSHMGLE